MITCVIFGAVLPLLYAIAFIVLLTSYIFNKYLILNFYRNSHDFNENLVFQSNKMLLVPILIHLVFTTASLHQSSMLRDPVFYSDDNLNNEITTAQLEQKLIYEDVSARNEYYTHEQGWYISYFFFVLLFYVFNIFVINPVTCCIQEGFLFVVEPKPVRRRNSLGRNSIRRQGIAGEGEGPPSGSI